MSIISSSALYLHQSYLASLLFRTVAFPPQPSYIVESSAAVLCTKILSQLSNSTSGSARRRIAVQASKDPMLLPSALPCEGAATQMRPQRPKLVSLTAYQPQLQAQIQQAQCGLSASCRTLQTILGNSLPSPRLLSRASKKQLQNPFEASFAQSTRNTQPTPPPRGVNKRRREEFEVDQESLEIHEEKAFSTPKRQRRIPVTMPLGLSAADFQALEPPSLSSSPSLSMPDLSSPPSVSDDHDSGYGPSPTMSEQDMDWTIDDDRVLVETVLEKLQLSKRVWNDCARSLGKDKDSLGRRWQLLVDEGNVGLKRGGPVRRTDLEIRSW